MSAANEAGGPNRPMLQVVRGNPSPEQLAALIAVVASRSSAAPAARPAPSLWSRPVLRGPLSPGPSAWRAAALPS